MTAAPLQAAPGGTLPGMQTPSLFASLRQAAPQQYVSPWQSLAVAQVAPILPHLLAVVQTNPPLQLPPGPQSSGGGSSVTATPPAPPVAVALAPAAPTPAKPARPPPLPPLPAAPGVLTRAHPATAPTTSRT